VDASFENLVACALFGDGAGAFVVAREGEGDALAVLAEGIAEMQLDATIRAGWEIGDDGVAFVLPPAGVAPFRADLSTALAPLLGEGASSELAWSVHPADPITLRHVQQGLGLSTDAMAPAFEVLASFGNVVSAGSVFVLERCLARAEPGTRGVLLGVRPGLSVHAMGYTVGARWHD
jgi:predicted naringenin-chalcone synthase